MYWDPAKAIDDFVIVARLAGVELSASAIHVECLLAPHRPPSSLPEGRMAVYVFSRGDSVLKVGKVGPKSKARYTSQHYNPNSAMSTLAASILADAETYGLSEIDTQNVGKWITQNIDRVNLLKAKTESVRTLTLLEAFLQCRLRPIYEGPKSQFASKDGFRLP